LTGFPPTDVRDGSWMSQIGASETGARIRFICSIPDLDETIVLNGRERGGCRMYDGNATRNDQERTCEAVAKSVPSLE
jgi:hypothetical protein